MALLPHDVWIHPDDSIELSGHKSKSDGSKYPYLCIKASNRVGEVNIYFDGLAEAREFAEAIIHICDRIEMPMHEVKDVRLHGGQVV